MDDSNNCLLLRKVINSDEILLFNCANNSDFREGSFNKDFMKLAEHKIWFNQKLDNVNV